VVSEVARRHDISPQHLFAWRKAARAGQLILPMDDAPAFVPVVTAPRHEAAPASTRNGRGAITIEIGGAVVRAEPGVDLVWLRDVLRAVRAAAWLRFQLAYASSSLPSALVRETLREDPFSGVVVIFRSKRADRLKIVTWDGSGLVLVWKRLEHSAFRWPPISDGVMRLSPAQMAALFDGMDWSRLHARDVARPTATSWACDRLNQAASSVTI
jgi:transposase